MEKLKNLIETMGRSVEEFKVANDARITAIEAKGYAPADLEEKVDRINQDLSAMSAMKTQLEALETAIGRGQFPGGGSSEIDVVKAEHNKLFGKWMRTGADAGLRDLEVRAEMSTLSDPDGGFLQSDPVKGAMKEVLSAKSAMRELADVITITGPEYKTLVDQLGESSEDVTEKGSRSTTDTPTFAEVSVFPKEMSAKPKVTQTMLDDPAFNAEAFIGKAIGRTFAAREGTWFWEGDGVKQAKGIHAYTTVANASYAWGSIGHIASGTAATLTKADTIIELQHALKSGYRAGAKFMMNDNTLLAIRKLKDGEGNYIWRAGLIEGAPDTLLGKPIAIDDYVDDIGTNAYPIWFANWKEAYLIIDRQGVRMLRDPYSSKPYVEFYTTKRTGGGIIMYEAIKCIKCAVS